MTPTTRQRRRSTLALAAATAVVALGVVTGTAGLIRSDHLAATATQANRLGANAGARADQANRAAGKAQTQAAQAAADAAAAKANEVKLANALTTSRDQVIATGHKPVTPTPAQVVASRPAPQSLQGAAGLSVTGPAGPVGPGGPPGASPGCLRDVLQCMGLPGRDSTVAGPSGANGAASNVAGPVGPVGPPSQVPGPIGANGQPGPYPLALFVLDPNHPGGVFVCPETSTVPAPGSGQYAIPPGGCTYMPPPTPTTTVP